MVASLLMIHGLHPVPVEKRVAGRSTRCGPTWSRTAGTWSSSEIEDGVARLRLMGSCNGCAASSSTLELAVEKAIAGGGAGRARDVRGGRRRQARLRATPARRCRWPRATGTRPAASTTGRRSTAWTTSSEDEIARLSTVGQERLLVAPAWRDACWPTATPARPAVVARPGRSCSEGVLTCPSCGRALLPPAGGPVAGRRADSARARCRCCADGRASAPGWRSVVSGCTSGGGRSRPRRGLGCVASRCRRSAGAAPRRWRPSVRPVWDLDAGGPPSPAPAGRAAASSACARAAGRCGSGDAGVRAHRLAVGVAGGASTLPDDLWARFRIPIGLAFFLRTARRAGGGVLPESGRRHGVGAGPGRAGASS